MRSRSKFGALLDVLLGAFLAAGLIAVLLALPAGSAAAQGKKEQDNPEQLLKKRDAAKIDLDYRKALERTQDEAAPTPKLDPWANMRGTADSKPKR